MGSSASLQESGSDSRGSDSESAAILPWRRILERRRLIVNVLRPVQRFLQAASKKNIPKFQAHPTRRIPSQESHHAYAVFWSSTTSGSLSATVS
eukprot:280593-Hanusia_phi.AAC.1